MRKLRNVFLIVLLVFCIFAIPGKAMAEKNGDDNKTSEGKFQSNLELNAYWKENGYPDKVAGVYSKGDLETNMWVLVVDGDAKTIEEIMDMVEDASGLHFESAEYSYDELQEVMEYIFKEYPLSYTYIGINDSDNVVEVSFYTKADNYKKAAKAVQDKYGNMVRVKYSDSLAQNLTGVETKEPSKKQDTNIAYGAVLGVLAIGILGMSVWGDFVNKKEGIE